MAKQGVEYIPNRALGRTPPSLFVLKISIAMALLQLLFLSFLYLSKALRFDWGHVALVLAVNIGPALVFFYLGRLFIVYRVHAASSGLLLTLILAAFPLTHLSTGETPSIKALVAALIFSSLLGLVCWGFKKTIDSPTTREIPQGPYGFLDQSSGEVDVAAVPVTPKQLDQMSRLGKYLLVVGLLIILLLRLMRPPVDLVLMVLNLVLAAMFAQGLGGTLAYIITTRRWEKEHGMRMRIKRERTPILHR